MNLIKKNIHMDCVKSKATSQITLEDDINIQDVKPDIEKIIFDTGDVKIEEVKVSGDHVLVRGRLAASVLYVSDDEDENIGKVDAGIPFEEQMFLEGVQSGDNVDFKWDLDDLTIGIINSRKISVRAIVSIQLMLKELYDEEAAVELYSEEPIEYRKKTLDIAELGIAKKDIYRVRQEVELPSNLPNIFQVIWDSIRICNLEFKALEEKVSIQGEMAVFVLYEGEGEDRPIRWYETTTPFSGVIECHGSKEMMIPDIRYKVSQREFEVRPDFDGEERMIGMDVVLDLDMKMYGEEKIDILADVYGVTKEVKAVTNIRNLKNLLVKNAGKCRVSEHLKVKSGSSRILQLIHSEGEAKVDETRIVEDGLQVDGTVIVKCLYVTSDDKIPYYSLQGAIPFSYVIDAKDIHNRCSYSVAASVEQLNVSMLDGEELEVKIVINVGAIIFSDTEEEMIANIEVEDLDLSKLEQLPGMAVYVAKEGDSLWQIGKKYYVPVRSIKEINNLLNDECNIGDKLLIVKGMNP